MSISGCHNAHLGCLIVHGVVSVESLRDETLAADVLMRHKHMSSGA